MSLLDRRFIVLAGKGGVGRTTVAACLARVLAARGRRVLVAQTDAPERLGALFGRPGPIGPTLTPVAEGIDAINMTPKASLHEYAVQVLHSEALYRAVFENKTARGFLGAVPGLDAWSMLGKAWFHTTVAGDDGRPRWDAVLLDGPASGHAAAMLRIPQAILDGVGRGPLIADARAARELLTDPLRTAVVIVTLPEELPARETSELARTLRGELGLPLGPVVVNGMPSDRLSDPIVAAVLDRASPPTGDAAADATLRMAAGLRAHRRTAELIVARLSQDPGLPLIALPRLYTAEMGPPEIERLTAALDAALA